MNIGDKIYCLQNEMIGEIIIISPIIGGNKYDVKIQDERIKKFFIIKLIEKDFLSMEQCADMFANKQLEQLVLNYKK